MDDAYRIEFVAEPQESAWGIIGRGVGAYNDQQVGDQNFQRVCFALYDTERQIVGGVLGEIYYDWLHVDLLWVKEELRNQGHGQRLLTRVEEEARQRGANNAFLDTFSFQAPDFYVRQGYRVFGELADFPAGHRRLFFSKRL